MSEIKPILKPVDVDLQTRISGQQKELDLGIKAREFTRDQAKPIQDSLNRIKEQHDRLKAREALTPKEIKTLSRMLDETSDQIFRLTQKIKKSSQNPVH